MKKKVFYIFRHGETFVTKQKGFGLGGIAYGFQIFSAPILDEGKLAIERIGNFLKDKNLDYCVSSPIFRCRQTTAIVEKITKIPFHYDNRLKEIVLERYGSVRKRVKNFLDEVHESSHTSIAICTHGGVIAVMLALLTSRIEHISAFSLFHYPPPGVLTIVEGENTQEINFNE